MTTHTPGPWSLVETTDPKVISNWHVQVGEYAVPVFPYRPETTPSGQFLGYVTDRKRMADARLMAASPCLLDSLIELYDALDSCVDLTPEVMQNARTAIAKATGA